MEPLMEFNNEAGRHAQVTVFSRDDHSERWTYKLRIVEPNGKAGAWQDTDEPDFPTERDAYEAASAAARREVPRD